MTRDLLVEVIFIPGPRDGVDSGIFAVQQQKRFIKFWALNKTEDRGLDKRQYLRPNQDPEVVFLDFEHYHV